MRSCRRLGIQFQLTESTWAASGEMPMITSTQKGPTVITQMGPTKVKNRIGIQEGHQLVSGFLTV